jgi:hypothetical protein
MMSDGAIHVVYRAVIGERVADPMTARVTVAKITISVIDPAVEPDGRTPMPGMKDVDGAGRAPICGSPEKAYAGRSSPDAGNPNVSLIPPVPVPRRPKRTVLRERGLILLG